MDCQSFEKCGGCTYLQSDEDMYKQTKFENFKLILKNINQEKIKFVNPVFISEGKRRRTSFVFSYKKGSIELGFNEKSSHDIVDIEKCPLLTDKINNNLETIKNLILEICKSPIVEKVKKGKTKSTNINSGDILVCEADNGLDVVLEIKENLSLDHRMIIFETLQRNEEIIRISHRKDAFDEAETITEKTKPFINISEIPIFISAGTFLQASKEGEKALVDLVTKYVGDSNLKSIKIADLFCGIGTFSYPLSKNKNNKVIAIDSSKPLLEGFKTTINKNMITNIEIIQKNLFKYPLDEQELTGFDIIVFDPPRSGANAQMIKISNLENTEKPNKIIAVSCNPHSFVKDANTLISAGYAAEEIALVDQFTYSNHFELVALFTKQS